MIFLDLDGVIVSLAKNVDDYNKPEIFSTLGLLDGAEKFVKDLKELAKANNEHVVVISKVFVTHDDDRYRRQELDKVRTCKKLGFDYDEIIILPTNIDKNIFCHKFDILIDDYGVNCQKWELVGGASIQFNEEKRKDWLTARNYDDTLLKIKLYLSAISLYRKPKLA